MDTKDPKQNFVPAKRIIMLIDLAGYAKAFQSEDDVKMAALAGRYQLKLALGVNLHLTSAIEAELGVGASKRRDIVGRGVHQTCLLGRGPGIRISEPVYRALPSNARSRWIKHKPPAVYHMDAPDGIYEGLGKLPGSNAMRW